MKPPLRKGYSEPCPIERSPAYFRLQQLSCCYLDARSPQHDAVFSRFIRYVLNSSIRPEWTTPSLSNWRGFGNYQYVLNAKDFWFAIQNSAIHCCQYSGSDSGSWAWIAVLINKSFPGRGIVRVLLISPFFVMPAVNAVLWINMILDPVLGLQGIAVGGLTL